MDISAVLNVTDDVLKDMGLSTAVHRLSLRGFCSTAQEKQHKEEKESKRRRLLEAFLSSKKGPLRPRLVQATNSQRKSLKVQTSTSWMETLPRGGRRDYVLVPLSKGGGSRYTAMLLSSNRIEVMKLCKSILFPNGVSYYGRTEDMVFHIGNVHNEEMGVILQVNGRHVPFNIGNYMEAYKLKDVGLYVLSKKMTTSSDESDDGLPPMIMSHDPTTSERACEAATSTEDRQDDNKGLIGTTEQRESLKRSNIPSTNFH